jgi:hypothetical protein
VDVRLTVTIASVALSTRAVAVQVHFLLRAAVRRPRRYAMEGTATRAGNDAAEAVHAVPVLLRLATVSLHPNHHDLVVR